MRLHLRLQATALTVALFAISTTTALPTFGALASLLHYSKRSPQPPFQMEPLNDDEMEAAAQAWGIEDPDIPFANILWQAAAAG